MTDIPGIITGSCVEFLEQRLNDNPKSYCHCLFLEEGNTTYTYFIRVFFSYKIANNESLPIKSCCACRHSFVTAAVGLVDFHVTPERGHMAIV